MKREENIKRKYMVVNTNVSFSDAVELSLDGDTLRTPEIFDSLEEALNSSRWLISGALYILSYNATKIMGYRAGDFVIEASK